MIFRNALKQRQPMHDQSSSDNSSQDSMERFHPRNHQIKNLGKIAEEEGELTENRGQENNTRGFCDIADRQMWSRSSSSSSQHRFEINNRKSLEYNSGEISDETLSDENEDEFENEEDNSDFEVLPYIEYK